MDKNVSSIHPGEILLEDFMKPLGLTDLPRLSGRTTHGSLG